MDADVVGSAPPMRSITITTNSPINKERRRMSEPAELSASYREYDAWDRTTRWFHWINVVCVIGLIAFGTLILNAGDLGVSDAGKVTLKTLHVYVGYVFAANLAWRIAWAFFGSVRARWKYLLPFHRGYVADLRQYVRGMRSGDEPRYLGHNPVGRLMVAALLLLLVTQATTGLTLAGTDLYKPPFGSIIAEWVTGGDADKLSKLSPGSKEFVDPAAYDEMRTFRKPFITTHKFVFVLLMIAILLHITGVVVTEIRERSGLVSAMITGRKVFPKPPADSDSSAISTSTGDPGSLESTKPR